MQKSSRWPFSVNCITFSVSVRFDLIIHSSNYAEVLQKQATTHISEYTFVVPCYYSSLLKTKTHIFCFSSHLSGQGDPIYIWTKQNMHFFKLSQSSACAFDLYAQNTAPSGQWHGQNVNSRGRPLKVNIENVTRGKLKISHPSIKSHTERKRSLTNAHPEW